MFISSPLTSDLALARIQGIFHIAEQAKDAQDQSLIQFNLRQCKIFVCSFSAGASVPVPGNFCLVGNTGVNTPAHILLVTFILSYLSNVVDPDMQPGKNCIFFHYYVHQNAKNLMCDYSTFKYTF